MPRTARSRGAVRNDNPLPQVRQPRLDRPNDQLVHIASILESTLDGHIDEPRQRTVERGHLVCDGRRRWQQRPANFSRRHHPRVGGFGPEPVRHECRIGGKGRQAHALFAARPGGGTDGQVRVAMRVLTVSTSRLSSAMSPIQMLCARVVGARTVKSSVEGKSTGGKLTIELLATAKLRCERPSNGRREFLRRDVGEGMRAGCIRGRERGRCERLGLSDPTRR